MKKTKKILLCMILIIVCGYGCNILFWNKFYSHSLYYAEHTPHDEGYYPELVLFLKEFDKLPTGAREQFYDKSFSDGSISTVDDQYITSNLGTELYFLDKKTSKSYSLNNKGKIINYDDYIEGKNMTKLERQEFETMVSKFLEPMKKATYQPLINFQWLFDEIYEGRFVDN